MSKLFLANFAEFLDYIQKFMTIKNLPFILDIKDIFRTALPKGRTEITVFLGLLLFYLSYSLVIVFNSYAIDHKVFDTDLYFSFDNPIVLRYGRTNISGHPLMFAFCYPLVLIGDFLAYLIDYKAKTLMFVLISASSISMSCVYIFRYLKEIVELRSKISLLITLFYAFFFMNLILAFTPESFTFSAMMLSFTVYYYSAYIKRGESPSLFSSVLLADVFLGGMTITNMAKGVIPMLFLKEKFWTIVKRIFVVGLVFISIIFAVHFASLYFLDKNLFISILVHQNAWTTDPDFLSNMWIFVYNKFYSIPVFFSDYQLNGRLDKETGKEQFFLGVKLYQSLWQYIVGILTLFFVIVGILRNYKNRFALMVVLLLSFDIFLHLILRFGLFDPFIYGAHWLYCVPLLIGWMYKSFKNVYVSKLLFCVICCMFVALVVNNMSHIYNFTTLAAELFPLD